MIVIIVGLETPFTWKATSGCVSSCMQLKSVGSKLLGDLPVFHENTYAIPYSAGAVV